MCYFNSSASHHQGRSLENQEFGFTAKSNLAGWVKNGGLPILGLPFTPKRKRFLQTEDTDSGEQTRVAGSNTALTRQAGGGGGRWVRRVGDRNGIHVHA